MGILDSFCYMVPQELFFLYYSPWIFFKAHTFPHARHSSHVPYCLPGWVTCRSLRFVNCCGAERVPGPRSYSHTSLLKATGRVTTLEEGLVINKTTQKLGPFISKFSQMLLSHFCYILLHHKSSLSLSSYLARKQVTRYSEQCGVRLMVAWKVAPLGL